MIKELEAINVPRVSNKDKVTLKQIAKHLLMYHNDDWVDIFKIDWTISFKCSADCWQTIDS